MKLHRTHAVAAGLAVFALGLAAGPAAAAGAAPRWQGGAQLAIASANGEAGDPLGTGVGIELYAVRRFDAAGRFGVRLHAGLADFGSETRSVALAGPGPSIGVQVNDKRTVTSLGLGPEISWPLGRFRAYGFATAGLGLFNSEVDLVGRDSSGLIIALTGQENHVVAGFGGGGGLAMRITSSVGLDVGAEYRRYSRVTTLGDDVVETSDGTVLIPVHHGAAGLLVIRLGATVALPLPGGRHGGERGRPPGSRGG